MNAATLEEACSILKDIDFSSKLSNERAGYVLLALAGLKGEESWDQATDNAIRIHDIIDIINGSVFNKTYKENSRESVRKGTVAPLVAAGLVMKNPGMDDSPTNSGKTCYALTDEMLKLLRAFGTDRYNRELIRVRSVAADRADGLVPNRRVAKSHIVLPSGMTQAVTKKGQGVIISAIIEEFLPRYAPESEVLFISDAEGDIYLDRCQDALLPTALKAAIESAEKTVGSPCKPDVIAWQPSTSWLFVCEACFSGGEIDEARKKMIGCMLRDLTPEIVYVTCFRDRGSLRKWIGELAWETEAWCMSDPDHLIHLDGSRFLGPYPDDIEITALSYDGMECLS
ncbi:MAG: BsuBI/PstI family type II restriction endonuclease [Raoultibacter sp.]